MPFARGGIVNRPTVFPFRRGVGLMGEAGPEAIMPLERVGGKLGVNARGGGVSVVVNDYRSGGASPEIETGTGPDGRQVLRFAIRDAVDGMVRDGSLHRSLNRTYGVQRRPTGR